jgi:hypothetical protein
MGIAACCALAASGHTTVALPRNVKNSRRLIAAPRLRTGHRINPHQ